MDFVFINTKSKQGHNYHEIHSGLDQLNAHAFKLYVNCFKEVHAFVWLIL